MEEKSDTLELGGNIELAGFKDLDGATLIVIKKIVGNYAKKFSESIQNFEKLKVTRKSVHKTEASEINEIHAQLIAAGNPTNASEEDRNLFFALDNVMKKIETGLSK